MEIFNNTTKVVKDDLAKKIHQGSRVSIAAACFSIYAYQELKVQLSETKQTPFSASETDRSSGCDKLQRNI